MPLKLFSYSRYFLIISVVVYFSADYAEIDTFSWLASLGRAIEALNLQALLVPALLVVFGVCCDFWRMKKRNIVKAEQVKVLRGAMVNVDHLFRNLLNTLYYFKAAMQDQSDFPEETIELFDKVIDDTTSELTKLGETSDFPEAMQDGIIENKKGL